MATPPRADNGWIKAPLRPPATGLALLVSAEEAEFTGRRQEFPRKATPRGKAVKMSVFPHLPLVEGPDFQPAVRALEPAGACQAKNGRNGKRFAQKRTFCFGTATHHERGSRPSWVGVGSRRCSIRCDAANHAWQEKTGADRKRFLGQTGSVFPHRAAGRPQTRLKAADCTVTVQTLPPHPSTETPTLS